MDRNREKLQRIGIAELFKKMVEQQLKALIKPQYIDQIPRAIKTEVT